MGEAAAPLQSGEGGPDSGSTKKCSKCSATKPTCEFSKSSKSRDGLHSYCRTCLSRYDDARRARWRSRPCTIPGCGRGQYRAGLCHTHNQRQVLGKEMYAPIRAKAPNGAGGIDASGYRRLRVDGEYEFEHRMVMERQLGRPLRAGENVHHINGDRQDNRPENLELWSTSQPPGQRARDKFEWAKKMIEEYGCRYLLGNGPELGPVYCEKFADGHDFCAEHRADEDDEN